MTVRRKFRYLYRSRYVCLTAVWAFTFLMCYVKTIFESFSSVDELSCVDRKYPNSARFELELDGPMFSIHMPLHSATTAIQNLYFYRYPSLFFELSFYFFLFLINSFWLFRTFWCFDVLNFDVLSFGERNYWLSATFKLAQEDPIWFRVRRLNHSAMTAWQSSYFHLCGSFFVELLCELILSQSITYLPSFGSSRLVDGFNNVDRKLSKSARYELRLDEPIWVLVKRPQRNQLWLLIRFPN